MIRKVLVTIFFFGSLAVSCSAQQAIDVRVDSTKPTVYLAFERVGENGSVWLRLHNNTQWAISLLTKTPGAVLAPLRLISGRTVSALADGSEIAPEYLIENVPDPGYGEYWCTITQSWLAPGQSAIFSFPREHLKFLGRVSVSFKYEWESEGQEPELRVRFNETDLSRILAPAAP